MKENEMFENNLLEKRYQELVRNGHTVTDAILIVISEPPKDEEVTVVHNVKCSSGMVYKET